jgi:hypothetical protein
LRRYVHPACREFGFRIGGWRDFRHTVATWALKHYPTKTVSAMLGHSSVRTALDTYAHVLEGDFAVLRAGMGGQLLRDIAKNGGSQIPAWLSFCEERIRWAAQGSNLEPAD